MASSLESTGGTVSGNDESRPGGSKRTGASSTGVSGGALRSLASSSGVGATAGAGRLRTGLYGVEPVTVRKSVELIAAENLADHIDMNFG